MKMKFVSQTDSTDCAAACLAMMSIYHGKDTTVGKMREACGTTTNGTSLTGLIKAAERLGFDAKALRISNEQLLLRPFELPAIFHTVTEEGLNHFIIVTKMTKKSFHIIDPGFGKITMSHEEFFERFDNIVVLLKPNDSFVPEGTKTRGMLGQFLELMRPQRYLFITAIVAAFLMTLLGIASSFFNQILIDEILPYNLRDQLVGLCIAFFIIGLVNIIIGAIRQHTLLHLSQKLSIWLMMGYYRHIFRLPMKFFGTRKTGDILTRFQDTTTVSNVASNIILTVVVDVVFAVISGIILFQINATLFGIVIIMTTISIIMIFIFKQPYKRLNREAMIAESKLNSQMIDSLRGIETVKVTSAYDERMDAIESRMIDTLKITYRENVTGNIQGSISGVVNSLGTIVSMFVGATMIMDGNLTLGTLMAFNALSGFFTSPISRLVSLQMQIQEGEIALNRLTEMYETDEEDIDRPDKGEISLKGDIRMDDVSFGYGSEKKLIENMDLHITYGEKIAIVGGNGCGKTTLCKMLAGLWMPVSGKIRIAGKDVSQENLRRWRERIAYVQQNVELFSGTILQNLTMGSTERTREEIDWACEQADCDELIERLQGGYNYYLNEAGANLSGGERQRLSIARALLKEPDLMILDEATSNLDFMSESKVCDTIIGMECTVIIIAHRLSAISNCDRILVMDNGKIVENGTHDELLELNGTYTKLWNSQMRPRGSKKITPRSTETMSYS